MTLPKVNIRLSDHLQVPNRDRERGDGVQKSGEIRFAPLESQGVERNIDSWERSFITCFGFLNFKTFHQIS